MKRLITLEEHYSSPNINRKAAEMAARDGIKIGPNDARGNGGEMMRLVQNIDDERVAYMDKAGIDMQVISIAGGVPSTLDPKYSIPLCREANDEMSELTGRYPGRFAVFANLPLADGDAMAAELERCVKEKGFVGAMIAGHYNCKGYDDPSFEPLYSKAEELDVPLYLHPSFIDKTINDKYYAGSWPKKVEFELSGFGIGWHYDVGMQVVRMILAGVFDRHPDLKIIIGHWGEVVSYFMDRLDEVKQEDTGLNKPISRYFEDNVYVNPSGMTYGANFRYCLEKFGADHILWGEDYPYRMPDNIRSMLENCDLNNADKEKIAHGNAERLFKLEDK